jgi:hypothetical protein
MRLSPGLVEQLSRWNLKGRRQFAKRRDLRVAFPRLDPADLSRVNATAFGYLLLRQSQLLASSTEVGAEVAHALDRRGSAHMTP